MRLLARKHDATARPPWPYTFFWFLIWLLIPFTILLLSELLVRMVWGDRINVQYTSDALYLPNAYSPRTSGWRPGAAGGSHGKPVRINSLGLRGAEISLSKANPKILLLGDSVLFGAGVEEENTNDIEDQPIQIKRVYSEYGVDFILAYLRAHSKLYLLLKDLIWFYL